MDALQRIGVIVEKVTKEINGVTTPCLEIICVYCHKANYIPMSPETEKNVEDWLSGAGYIQDLCSELSAAERELLISKICDNCWHTLFDTVEEEEGI